MADTRRSESALAALLADNASGDISPQDLRDLLTSVHSEQAFKAGTFAARPSSGNLTGDHYFATDLGTEYRWNGSSWVSLLGGRIVQVVNTQTGAMATGTTEIPFDDTIPQNTEGDEYMTLAITPTSVTNVLLIEVEAMVSVSSPQWISLALFQDTTADALAAVTAFMETSAGGFMMPLRHKMTTGTTAATTFKVRIGRQSGAGTVTFNGQSGGRLFGGVMASSITITEIAA